MNINITHSNLTSKETKANYILFNLIHILMKFGRGMLPVGTMLTYYVINYTDSNFFVGLMNFINPVMALLPQIFIARYLKRFKYSKTLLVVTGTFSSIMWLVLGVVTLTVHNNAVNLAVFLILFGAVQSGKAFRRIGWSDIMSKAIPQDTWGRFIGFRSFFGGISEFLATLFMGYILSAFVFPGNYAAAFLIVGTVETVSNVLYIFAAEPPGKHLTDEKIPFSDYIRQLLKIPKMNSSFRWFVIYDCFAVISKTVFAFLIVYAKWKINITPVQMVAATATFVVSKTVFSLLWGYLNDKTGYKLSMTASAAGYACVNLIALLFMKHVYVFISLYVLMGMFQSARIAGRNNIVMKLAGNDDVRSYVALHNVLIFIPFSVFPLLCGLLIDFAGYIPFFIINTLGGIAAAAIMIIYVNFNDHKEEEKR